MFVTYILQSQVNYKYYIGHAENLDLRLSRHNKGFVRSTKSGVPWKVIYTEIFNSKQEAYKRERQMKSYKGGEAFKKLL